MAADYVAIVRPEHEDSQNLVDVNQVGIAELRALLTEAAARDPGIKRRLRELATQHRTTSFRANHASPAAGTPDNRGTYMVGGSPVMKAVFEAIRRYASSDAPVLILGETGTGKELVARALHERSAFRNGPFVAINCGALPNNLVGSELFGFEKGAFTGALKRNIGKIEAAQGGTVFLDEIGDLPVETQVHLLRFLQEKTIQRIGAHEQIAVNARIVAATNIDLAAAVTERRFREDLYYRLNVLPVSLPRLCDRGDDILLLAKFFLKLFGEELGGKTFELAPEAEHYIMTHTWPGNVRELIACLRRGVVMATGATIHISDLGIVTRIAGKIGLPEGLSKARGDAKSAALRKTLEEQKFNISRSARELRISRVTLYRLLEKHQIFIGPTGFATDRGKTS